MMVCFLDNKRVDGGGWYLMITTHDDVYMGAGLVDCDDDFDIKNPRKSQKEFFGCLALKRNYVPQIVSMAFLKEMVRIRPKQNDINNVIIDCLNCESDEPYDYIKILGKYDADGGNLKKVDVYGD